MNHIIAVSVLFSFCISFGLLFLLIEISDEITLSQKIENFYSQDLGNNKKKIFLIGSSYVGTLNTTLINEKIFFIDKNYEVYNLAITSDHPEKRIHQIEQIISMKPNMIFYGVSFFDFQSTIEKNTHFLPDVPRLPSSIKSEVESLNPKLITLQSFRQILVENGIKLGIDSRYSLPNTPFFSFGSSSSKILNEEQLRNDALGKADVIQNIKIKHDSNSKLFSLKEIIKQLNDNQIDVVIFVSPLHENYINFIPNESKNSFKIILNEISEEFDIEIIDLLHNYEDLNVWRDLTHISYNKKSMIYSEDIAHAIIKEIKK